MRHEIEREIRIWNGHYWFYVSNEAKAHILSVFRSRNRVSHLSRSFTRWLYLSCLYTHLMYAYNIHLRMFRFYFWTNFLLSACCIIDLPIATYEQSDKKLTQNDDEEEKKRPMMNEAI